MSWLKTKISKSIFGQAALAKKVHRDSVQIRKAEQNAASLTDSELKTNAETIRGLKEQERHERKIEFAGLIANAVTRGAGFRLHEVQLLAIAAAVRGAIVEMQTGEGKTVVTGCAAAMQTLFSTSVHVGTTNTYLAQRDREAMIPVWDHLGITSGLLSAENDETTTKAAYRSDITYGAGYQFGFDYLHDQIYLRENRESRLGQKTLNRISGINLEDNLLQKLPHDAILIDEADSVMIDEAATPLVISGGEANIENPKPFLIAREFAANLTENDDFEIKLNTKEIKLKDQVSARCHEALQGKRYGLKRPWTTYITNAIRAQRILQRNIDYVVRDEAIAIVDQNTGRIFDDRTWQDGLHQAVACKEGLVIKGAPTSFARVTRQRYLQLYPHLAGFTGTASAVSNEFREVYSTFVFPVPTNLPNKRIHHPTRFFSNEEAKMNAIADSVLQIHQTGQPILIGARTINESNQVHELLLQRNFPSTVLNGIQNEEEAEIIASAGHAGKVTIATNMAGRGTDIKPDQAALKNGGLFVIGISPNMSTRIDRQLAGRAARQGDPGCCQFFAAASDEVIQVHDPRLGDRIVSHCDANGESRRDFSQSLAQLQNRLETKFAEQRRQMVLNDRWMDKVRESFEKEESHETSI